MATACVRVVREFGANNPWELYAMKSSTVVEYGVYNVSGIGAVVCKQGSSDGLTVAYWGAGVFLCSIDTAITISRGDRVWYNSGTDKVSNVVPSSGFFMGIAAADGTAAAGYVEVILRNVLTGPAVVLVDSGRATTAGGDAIETVTVTGSLTSDYVKVTDESGLGLAVKTALISSAGTLTTVLSADPGTTGILQWEVWRKL